MELYTLDSLFRRTELVEGYESYLWTERYNDMGDLQIITASTGQFRNLLASGTFLGHSESKRVMKVETIVDTVNDDGDKQLTFTCIEISDLLNDRVSATGYLGVEPQTWVYENSPGNIIRRLFDFVVRTGGASTSDMVPRLAAGSMYAPGNLPEDTRGYRIERKIGSLHTAMKEIAEVWDLGFRLHKGPDNGNLYFDVYKGNDRTAGQTTKSPVIFSEDLDSLQSVSELTSVAKSKNVAHVSNAYRTVFAYADGATVDTAGFAKRTLYVDASDIVYPNRTNLVTGGQQAAINKAIAFTTTFELEKDALNRLIRKERLIDGDSARISAVITRNASGWALGEDALIGTARDNSVALEPAETAVMIAALTQRGVEELAKNRSISAFDGEITQLSPYKYNRDYEMGDLVEMRSSTGLTNQMLVTEQIFADDATGERAYPTLTMKLFITPGSWLAWENTQVWQDAPGTWATS